jgi:phosphoribosylformylglycinamidine synthase
VTLWQIDIHPAAGQPDRLAEQVCADARDLGIGSRMRARSATGYLIEGNVSRADIHRAARYLFADTVVQAPEVAEAGDPKLSQMPDGFERLLHILLKPGVMDPVAQSAAAAMADQGLPVDAVQTFRKFWLAGIDDAETSVLCARVLANDSIEQVVHGPLRLDDLRLGSTYHFRKLTVPLLELSDDELLRLSRQRQLYLSLIEMQRIQSYYRELGRDPTDAELETIAQTWSEHCSHKTLRGRIEYRDENGTRRFDNLLKETIFAATQTIRAKLGSKDWCVSVFEDNAGIVRFDEQNNVVFKVETHNHPSALEPYGGANTGIGGVIRDPMGTGLGARPVCNTDVFCFAPPDTAWSELPPGVLHPRRVMKGVVSGVRDYGNRMGIPTVNGAVFFDPRYLGNPLVYCGNVGIIPRDKCRKRAERDDYIVVIGGRTGRDGIHGATFSSAELTSDSETVSGGAVQIGNAITEKMVLDVLLAARDQQLFNAVTDCGAGGFSSAIGEMGEHLGAEVWLDRAPLKYEGLSYTEIWISEAQERMVLAVPAEKWEAFARLCASEDVEATILGRFVATGRLQLKYAGHLVGDLDMRFLHDGRPPVVREATYSPREPQPLRTGTLAREHLNRALFDILGSLNVASKEWIIRQYDHEVQGGSVIKPLVGVHNDGPSDAAVIRPMLSSSRGLVVACGMNPHYGDHDTYAMAASAIDEAVRNCVAVGADPCRIAILDNFCWGYTDRAETLGSLVRAALGCHDVAVVLETPFISGKDSLNNEFSCLMPDGTSQTLSIPPSLLISALGQVDDVERCVTMDFKEPGNPIYQIGITKTELGGSHFCLVSQLQGGRVPRVDAALAKQVFRGVYLAIQAGCVRACHDLSEGGLAVSLAEMCFSGGWGARVNLDGLVIPDDETIDRAAVLLFSESNSRFLCEVRRDRIRDFERLFADLPCTRIGEVTNPDRIEVHDGDQRILDADINALKDAWQTPLRWS